MQNAIKQAMRAGVILVFALTCSSGLLAYGKVGDPRKPPLEIGIA